MIPTREEAKKLLAEAETHNPGAWARYSEVVAFCAERIAQACPDLDAEKAYVKRRYGAYPQDKWDRNLWLKDYFSNKAGKDIYSLFI